MKIHIRTTDPKVISIVFWIIWLMITCFAVMLQLVIPKIGGPALGKELPYLPLIPLTLSVLLRWMVLARIQTFRLVGSVFMVGMGITLFCPLLALLFMPPWRDAYFALTLLGLLQLAPLWARRMRW